MSGCRLQEEPALQPGEAEVVVQLLCLHHLVGRVLQLSVHKERGPQTHQGAQFAVQQDGIVGDVH